MVSNRLYSQRRLCLLALVLISAAFLGAVNGLVQPRTPVFVKHSNSMYTLQTDKTYSNLSSPTSWRTQCLNLWNPMASSQEKEEIEPVNDQTDPSFFSFDPVFGSLWFSFLTFGLFLSPGELNSDFDLALINNYIADPLSPTGDFNPLFYCIFNFLGTYPLLVTQLVFPSGDRPKNIGLPPAPFLLASGAMGYGAAGFYLTFRKPVVEDASPEDGFTWFTRNMWENKLVNLSMLGLIGSTLYGAYNLALATGGGSADWTSIGQDYWQLCQTSKFVSVSTFDFFVLTIAAAALIPGDYALRKSQAEDSSSFLDESETKLLAASTILLPVLGAALYCIWRPSLSASDSE